MNVQATLDQDIASLADQCGVDAMTVQQAAEGVARRLVALFGGAEQAAENMGADSVRAALSHYTETARQLAEQAIADPSQIIGMLYAGK